MWTEEQKLAIDKQNSNILVSASAGSGKTAVLVERVINKVIKYNVDIDKILVVTFTNAAAIELKERLMKAIYEALSKNKNDKFLKRQLTYINRASITTIHSFCLEVIRSNFQALNIDPNFKICDETESSILKVKALNYVLEQEYIKSNEDNNTKDKLYDLLELFGGKDENLSECFLKIYSYIQSFAYSFKWLKSAIDKYSTQGITNLYETDFGKSIYEDAISNIEILIKREEEILDKVRGNEDFFKYVEVLENDISLLKPCILNIENDWDKLYDILNTISFKRAPIYKGDNVELKQMVASFRSDILKKTVDKLKKSIYEKTELILEDQKKAYKYISYIYDFIIKFDKEYSRLKSEKNYIDFNDIEHLTLEILVKETDDGEFEYTQVANNLKEKFKEVYTDEYQDISFIQEAILKAVSKNNNRFMVGDIKQSIYKFRQAMPDIFNQKYDSYELIKEEDKEVENAKIVLAKNFRSRKEVLASINYIFEKIMSKELGDCSYEDMETLKFGATSYEENKEIDYKTKINIIDLKQEENLEEDEVTKYINELKNFEVEAIFVAKQIREIMNKYYSYSIKEKKFNKPKYKDIVILLRSIKDKGRILEDTLKKYSIPSFCDTSSNLFESEEIYLVLSLLRIIDNPYQDIHMISVMYSIVGEFNLDELVYIRQLDRKSRIYDNILSVKEILEEKADKSKFEEDLLNKLNRFIVTLKDLKNYSVTNSIATLIIKIYDATNIYRQYILDNNATQRKANLDLLVDVALKCEEQNILTLSEYISYVNNLKDKIDTSTTSAKIIGENEDVVRIMTIHKSKGLEFPFVILCDTTKKYNLLDASSTVTMHHELGLGINVVNDKYKVTYPSVIKQAIKKRIEKETKAEELRMLYVALTRAKEKLFIFSTVKDYEKFNKKQFVIYDKEKIIPSIVLNNNSYFENINMALKEYDKEKDKNLFDINILKAAENINVESIDEEEKKNINIKDIINRCDKYSSKEIEKELDIINQKMNFKYKYTEDIDVPSRVSVSQLKKEDIEENNILEIKYNNNNIDLSEKYKRPLNTEEENYTSARKGTLVHFILENLDLTMEYTIDSLKECILSLMKESIISENDIKHINANKILSFLNSDIGKEIRQSKFVRREQEFVLKDKNISKSVIQGIVDLYYINNNGNVILLDFKTDRLTKEEEYIERYNKQLEIYKVALEKLLNKKVEKTYIYSFYLDKKIEVK